jgi:hypothetical protein
MYFHEKRNRSTWDVGVAVAAIFVLFLALAAIPVALIPLHIPRDYNEGWNAYLSFAAITGGILYPPADALTLNNYPPLSFYFVGLFGQLAGDHILAGRIISFSSLGAIAANIFLLCRWMGCDRLLAAFGSGTFLATFCVFAPNFIAMNDPQLLGHASITSSAVIFLTTIERHQPRTASIAVSAFLVVLGVLVKHNLVALPLAMCTWAAIYDRRSLAKFVVAVSTIGALALATLYGIWGQRLVANILYHARVISFPHFLKQFRGVFRFLLVYFVITAVGFGLSTERRKISFVMIYVFWSAIVGFPLLAGMGVDLNVLFDLLIALAMGSVGCVLVLQPRDTDAHFWIGARRILTFAMILPGLVRAHNQQTIDGLYRQWHDASAWSELAHEISKVDGRVACGSLAVCYWAGKPFEVDFFNYGQKLFKNTVNDHVLQRRFESGYYAAILLPVAPSPVDPSAWIPFPYLPEMETSTLLMWYAPASGGVAPRIRCLRMFGAGSQCLLTRRQPGRGG